jgi:type IV pilus assembly protein PilA
MRKNLGFSLIELLIVVAIILILASIGVPYLLRARESANEASAVSSLRQIKTAEISYYEAYPSVGYAAKLQDLGGTGTPCTPAPATACLVDNSLATAVPGSGGKSGYQFAATGITSGSAQNTIFVLGASPLDSGHSGTRDFCINHDSGGILFQPSTSGDLPVTTYNACATFPNMVQ